MSNVWKRLRVGPVPFYGAGLQRVLHANDAEHLRRRISTYQLKWPDIAIGDFDSPRWEHTQPIWVHLGEVPEQFFDEGLNDTDAKAILSALRQDAERAVRANVGVRGHLTFGVFDLSLDGKSLHVVAWDNWIENG